MLSSFGPQHWQALLRLEQAAVMRLPVPASQWRIHPRHARDAASAPATWTPAMGTRLADGTVLPDHDDLDCIEDLRRVGLLHPTEAATLLPLGWSYAADARRYVATHGVVNGFSPASPHVECFAEGEDLHTPLVTTARVVRDEPRHVDVDVCGARFCFRAGRAGWNLHDVVATTGPTFLHEQWVGAARRVAVETLDDLLGARQGKAPPGAVLKCPACHRFLSGQGDDGLTLTRPSGAQPQSITCGATHIVNYYDGVTIEVLGGGRLTLVN